MAALAGRSLCSEDHSHASKNDFFAGGGLPQSNDPKILPKRIQGLYSIDERRVKRKSHENGDIRRLYKELLHMPLSNISHQVKWAE